MPLDQIPLDHVVVTTTRDLDDLQHLFTRLGFNLTPRGYHTLGSANHLAIFSDTYLELLGQGNGTARTDLLSFGDGLTGVALRAADATRLHSRLRDAGGAVSETRDFSRPVAIARRDASFRTFTYEGAGLAGGRLFFCQHNTPDLVWRADDQTHPNGVTDVLEVVVLGDPAQRDPLALIPGTELDSADALRVGGAKIRFQQAAALQDRFKTAIVDAPPAPSLFGLVLAVQDLAKARKLLAQNGLIVTDTDEGFAVSPDQTGNVALLFTQRP